MRWQWNFVCLRRSDFWTAYTRTKETTTDWWKGKREVFRGSKAVCSVNGPVALWSSRYWQNISMATFFPEWTSFRAYQLLRVYLCFAAERLACPTFKIKGCACLQHHIQGNGRYLTECNLLTITNCYLKCNKIALVSGEASGILQRATPLLVLLKDAKRLSALRCSDTPDGKRRYFICHILVYFLSMTVSVCGTSCFQC